MKTIRVVHSLIIGFTAILFATACGSKAPQSSANRTEIEMPFADHQTDDKAFRGVGVGQSPDRGFALEQAKLDARTSIAQEVATSVKSAIERYREEYNSADDTVEASYGAKMEELTLNLVDQTLNNTRVEKQRMFELDNKDQLLYEAHVAVTLPRDDMINALERAIDERNGMSEDDKVQIEYDRQRFREVFKQEMEQLRTEETPN